MMYKWSSLKKIYGSPYRLWAGSQLIVFVTEPEHVKTVLMSTKVKDKGSTYKFLTPFLGHGLFTGSGKTKSQYQFELMIISKKIHF